MMVSASPNHLTTPEETMGNSNEVIKQTVHIKNTKANPHDRKVAAENRLESALQVGAGGIPRYQLMEKLHQEELSGVAQQKARRFQFLDEKFATLGEVARFLKPGEKAPANTRQVKLKTHRQPIVLTSAEARELVNEFKKAIEAQLQEYKKVALETERDADELKEIMARNEVWVDDIKSKISSTLSTLIEGLGLGYREPGSNKVMVGTPAITALFTRLCM